MMSLEEPCTNGDFRRESERWFFTSAWTTLWEIGPPFFHSITYGKQAKRVSNRFHSRQRIPHPVQFVLLVKLLHRLMISEMLLTS